VFAPAHFFGPFADRYRERFAAAGHPREAMRVGNVFHAHIASTSQEARRRWEPYYRNYLSFVDAVWDGQALFDGQVRPRQSFDYDRLLASTAICGSPAEVTERLLEARDLLGLDLIALSMDLGALPRDLLMESIDLAGSSVLPALIGDHPA
jgi:alkanesulfonate monooxygenase SsuD/methylene tetrahydromethanopterin reductase-like flavin-dependent oxidoreductase (luciferase family)